jgi:hypothetical protein
MECERLYTNRMGEDIPRIHPQDGCRELFVNLPWRAITTRKDEGRARSGNLRCERRGGKSRTVISGPGSRGNLNQVTWPSLGRADSA